MTGRRPARLLAPLALVACAVALFIVATSGGVNDSTGTSTNGSARPSATATQSARQRRATSAAGTRRRSYTVKPGDTPSGIAQANGVSLQALLTANPDADPKALSPGQVLKLPAK